MNQLKSVVNFWMYKGDVFMIIERHDKKRFRMRIESAEDIHKTIDFTEPLFDKILDLYNSMRRERYQYIEDYSVHSYYDSAHISDSDVVARQEEQYSYGCSGRCSSCYHNGSCDVQDGDEYDNEGLSFI